MKMIRKAVEEFKKENGNENFSQKEMLMYLITRLDNLPCEQHIKTIAGNAARSKLMLVLYPLTVTIIGILYYIKT